MDSSNNTVVRGPKACTACAASKAKCIFTPTTANTNGKCDRCNRLNKDCVAQTAALRTRRQNRTTRVAQLEEKLEELVSQLGSSERPRSIRNENSTSSIQNSHAGSLFHEHNSDALSSSQYSNSPSSHGVAQAPTPSALVEKPIRGIDIRDPDSLLTLYRNNIANQFPFVIVPPETKAFELIHDKPFLFKNIAMVASAQDVKAQTRMAEEIIEYISLHLIIRAEKTFDLLQGLLIFIAWFHCHINLGRRLSILLQLAEALIIDLKLNREPLIGLERKAKEQEFWVFSQEIMGSEIRTLEERRAYLGQVYLSSAVSLYVNFIEPARYTHYAQACVSILQQSPLYLSDQYLVQLMKLQSIAEEISSVLPRDSFALSPLSSTASSYIKSLQAKLNMFEECLPIHLRTNKFLLMHYHSILVYLTETALYTPSLPSRQAILHACLTSIISFFSVLFSFPVAEYYKFPYLSWVQVNHSLTALSKLSLFTSDDWDLSHVGRMMDLSLVLDGILSRFNEVILLRREMAGVGSNSDSGVERGGSLFSKVIPKFQQQKAVFEIRRAEIMQMLNQRTVPVRQTAFSREQEPPQMQIMASLLPPESSNDQLIHYNQFDPPPVNFNQLDDAFWQEFVGDYSIN